jgi:hypothetical protein
MGSPMLVGEILKERCVWLACKNWLGLCQRERERERERSNGWKVMDDEDEDEDGDRRDDGQVLKGKEGEHKKNRRDGIKGRACHPTLSYTLEPGI